MSLAVRLAAEAAAELDEAAGWYESQRAGLGATFLDAVGAAIVLIADWPGVGAPAPGVTPELGARRVALQRFPFHLAYVASDGYVTVLVT